MRRNGSFSRGLLVVCSMVATSAGSGLRADMFVPTGPMGAPRARAAAAVAGGGVLVAGGSSFAAFCMPVDSAELYDPGTGQFLPTSPMNETRCEARAVTLDDGRVLIVGGLGSGIGNAELFDPGTGMYAPTGPLVHQRGAGFTVTLLSDGRVLVAGGDDFSGTTGVLEIFDPLTEQFSAAGSMTTPRSLHTATLLADGRVLFAGGGAGTTCAPLTESAEVYDPVQASSLATTGPPVAGLWGHAAAALPDGTVLLAGGDPTCGLGGPGSAEAQVYDPVSDDFSPVGGMGAIHGPGLAATSLADGRVLVAGGLDDGVPSGTGSLYSWSARSFGTPIPMSGPRSAHAQVLLSGGDVLLAGGESGVSDLTASAELFEASLTQLTARVDITPHTLNIRSAGRWVTVFVGVEGRDAREIDTTTIELRVDGGSGLSPAPAPRGYGDHDGDGTTDLMLKVPREAFTRSLGSGGEAGVVVTGTLRDGTPFSGEGIVRVIAPGRAGSAAARGVTVRGRRGGRRF